MYPYFFLIAIPLFIALFVPNDYNVESEIIIEKSNPEVFDYIKSLRNQNKFSKSANIDPKMKNSYWGTDKTVGFVSVWKVIIPKLELENKKLLELLKENELILNFAFINLLRQYLLLISLQTIISNMPKKTVKSLE